MKATLEIAADELGLLYKYATPAIVNEAHRSGILISVWTVDQPEDMRRMIELGVDGITTNYPDKLIRLLRKRLPSDFHGLRADRLSAFCCTVEMKNRFPIAKRSDGSANAEADAAHSVAVAMKC